MKGGIIDDLGIYKKRNDYLLVVNTSNREKIKMVEKHQNSNVAIKDISDSIGLLAVQGPSKIILNQLLI